MSLVLKLNSTDDSKPKKRLKDKGSMEKASIKSLRRAEHERSVTAKDSRRMAKERSSLRRRRKQRVNESILVVDEKGERVAGSDTATVPKRKKQRVYEKRVENKLWKAFDCVDNTERANPVFAEYYKRQLALEDEDWNQFMDSLTAPLKVTFRLNRGSFPFVVCSLEERMKEDFSFKGTFVRVGGDQVLNSSEILKPDESLRDVWRLAVDNAGLHKTDALEPLRSFIDSEASYGHLSRQGIASMLPALALAPFSQDPELLCCMCGAPGSKAEQILHMSSSAMVVVNDSDPKRLQNVEARLKGLSSGRYMLTCSRGQDLAKALPVETFDKIICDVPCSGDGTIRKNGSHLWKRWRPRTAVELHPLQLELIESAAQLLKVGSIMVYSTCSLNPIEDEAVVNALLERGQGAFELEKIELGALTLRAREGILSWDTDEELMNLGFSLRTGSGAKLQPVKVTETMKPSGSGNPGLKKCRRILPHDNDSEGFFIAKIRKKKPFMARVSSSLQDHVTLLESNGFNPKTCSDVKPRSFRFEDDTRALRAFGLDSLGKRLRVSANLVFRAPQPLWQLFDVLSKQETVHIHRIGARMEGRECAEELRLRESPNLKIVADVASFYALLSAAMESLRDDTGSLKEEMEEVLPEAFELPLGSVFVVALPYEVVEAAKSLPAASHHNSQQRRKRKISKAERKRAKQKGLTNFKPVQDAPANSVQLDMFSNCRKPHFAGIMEFRKTEPKNFDIITSANKIAALGRTLDFLLDL